MIFISTTPFRIKVHVAGLIAPLIMTANGPLAAEAASEPVAEAPAMEAAAQPAAAEPSTRELAATPSRNVTPEQLKLYVESMSAVFSMRHRATDPFGLLQDPDAKPIVKPKLAATRKYEPVKATPFADIVKLIKVTTIMPGERSFLIGNRRISQGDRLPLTFRGKNIMIEVAAVDSDRIKFRNLGDDETAEVALRMLPSGMSPGADGIAAPGMMPEDSNAPINLDGNAIPLNAVQNR
jgi:hypothetical protein